MFSDVTQTCEIKNLKKVEHFLWCSSLVGTWFIIVKVWGSIIYTCNLCASLKGQGRQVRLKQFHEVKLGQVGQARLTSTYLSAFFNLPKPIYYLLIYLPFNFLSNNLKHDFNLSINLTQLNSSLFTSQTVSHSISQSDKVQIDYLLMLASPN